MHAPDNIEPEMATRFVAVVSGWLQEECGLLQQADADAAALALLRQLGARNLLVARTPRTQAAFRSLTRWLTQSYAEVWRS